MEYKIVTSQDAGEVSDKVNELLKDGWRLYGELKTAAYFARWAGHGEEHSEHVWIFAQAMTKKEAKKAKSN